MPTWLSYKHCLTNLLSRRGISPLSPQICQLTHMSCRVHNKKLFSAKLHSSLSLRCTFTNTLFRSLFFASTSTKVRLLSSIMLYRLTCNTILYKSNHLFPLSLSVSSYTTYEFTFALIFYFVVFDSAMRVLIMDRLPLFPFLLKAYIYLFNIYICVWRYCAVRPRKMFFIKGTPNNCLSPLAACTIVWRSILLNDRTL